MCTLYRSTKAAINVIVKKLRHMLHSMEPVVHHGVQKARLQHFCCKFIATTTHKS